MKQYLISVIHLISSFFFIYPKRWCCLVLRFLSVFHSFLYRFSEFNIGFCKKKNTMKIFNYLDFNFSIVDIHVKFVRVLIIKMVEFRQKFNFCKFSYENRMFFFLSLHCTCLISIVWFKRALWILVVCDIFLKFRNVVYFTIRCNLIKRILRTILCFL